MPIEKFFRVVYKDYEKNASGTYEEIIREATVPWGDDIYDERVSYRDNLEFVLVGVFDTGFVEVAPSKFVSSSCILNISGCNANEVPQNVFYQEQKQEANNQNRQKKEQKFHRKVRRFGKEQLRQSRNNIPPKTTQPVQETPKSEPSQLPQDIIIKETQDPTSSLFLRPHKDETKSDIQGENQ